MTVPEASQWWAAGRTLEVPVAGGTRRVFIRDEGSGPCLTLLHGYPASSLEWAQMWPALASVRRVVALDFLGFGASEKPSRYSYPLDDQADVVEAVWRSLRIRETEVVAYDYGAIIAQVLQARHAPISQVTYLNAGLFPDLYRPRPIQRIAPLPVLGALLWRRYDETAFYRSWRAVFGPDHPLDRRAAREHWVALTRNDPKAGAARALLSYITQRADRADELVSTLSGPTPTRYLWGMADPVSGRLVAEGLRTRLRAPDLIEFPTVGHAPHLEIPDVIAAELVRG
ncbi:alpha/beta fold hydrolase [Dactylosporangium sp. CA-092794]|uniref:alpha/beta fold hydrolase n=1 Tax=Dactylosporangium sp. CA-092794 TaxID=3239929 RepID=UPI003D931EA2